MTSPRIIGKCLVDAIEKVFTDLGVGSSTDRAMAVLGYALGAWLGSGGSIDGFIDAARRAHRAANEALQ